MFDQVYTRIVFVLCRMNAAVVTQTSEGVRGKLAYMWGKSVEGENVLILMIIMLSQVYFMLTYLYFFTLQKEFLLNTPDTMKILSS